MVEPQHTPNLERLDTAIPTLTLGDLLAADVSADGPDPVLRGLDSDSRAIQPGWAFLACTGARVHGLEYARDALARGAIAILWEPPAPEATLANVAETASRMGAVLHRVPRLGQRSGVLADRLFGSPSHDLQIAGITGTNGKTSTSYFLAQMASLGDVPAGLIGTLGYGTAGDLVPGAHTTPDAPQLHRWLAAFRVARQTRVAMEVSSHALAQERVAGVRFDTAVFTNLSREHLDYHGSLEAYYRAKAKLFHTPGLRRACINLGDPFGRRLWNELPANIQDVAFWLSPAQPDVAYKRGVSGEVLARPGGGLQMTLRHQGKETLLEIPGLIGPFQGENLLAALTVLLGWGWELSELRQAASRLTPVPGRMEPFRLPNGALVIVDYAHTPDALDHCLRAARAHCTGRLSCVFGCGGDRDPGKRPLMGRVAYHHSDRLILTDDNPRTEPSERIIGDIRNGLPSEDTLTICPERHAAITSALAWARPEDCVVIAGKGHEAVQIRGNTTVPCDDRALVRAWAGGMEHAL